MTFMKTRKSTTIDNNDGAASGGEGSGGGRSARLSLEAKIC